MASHLQTILCLFLLLPFLPLQANTALLCVPIPERPQDVCRDPFNGDIPAANINVRIEGKERKHKPTIVFIHGVGENLSVWNCAQKALKKDYLTVAIDLRGYGQSSKTEAPIPPTVPPPEGDVNYTMQLFADDIYAVLSELCLTENIILVGHSIGSGIALNYATTYCGVEKLVLVSGSPLYFADCTETLPPCITTSSPEPFPNCSSCNGMCCRLYPANPRVTNPLCCVYPKSLQFIEIIEEQVAECLSGCTDPECALDCVLDLFTVPHVINEQCKSRSLTLLQQNFSLTTLAQFLDPVTFDIINSTILFASSQDQRDLLPYITIPTLICAGTIDADVDPRNSLYMHQRIPCSILAEFVGKGHMLNITDTYNFNKLLAGFLSDKKYCDTIRVGKKNCCTVCDSAFSSTDFTVCTPLGQR